MTRKIFYTLDGMRGLAALAVVERHRPDLFFGTAWPAGYLAVDLFFVLSGFVIAHAYEDRLRQGMSLKTFTLARLIRLYPLYLMSILFSTVLFAAFFMMNGDGGSWIKLAATLGTALVFLPAVPGFALDPVPLYPLNDPSWSLALEIAINIVFAAFILRLGLRRMVQIAALGAVGFVATAFHFGSADVGFDWRSAIGGVPRVTVSFFVGVLLYKIYLTDRHKLRHAWMGWPVQVVLFSCFLIPVAAAWRPAFDLFAVLVLFPLLVHVGARTDPGKASIAIFSALGAASYGVYVFHTPAARAFKAVVDRVGTADAASLAPWSGLVFVALLFAGCWLLDRFIDKPLRTWLTDRLIGRGQTGPHAARIARRALRDLSAPAR